MAGALLRLGVISMFLAALGACSYGTFASGLKPVVQNGWAAKPSGPDHDPGAVTTITDNVRITISPPMWHQTTFVGPAAPIVPVSSSDNNPILHANFYITAFQLRGNAIAELDLEGLQLRCMRQGQTRAEDIAYDFKASGTIAVATYVIPRADLRQMASCTLHFARVLKASPASLPDLVFNAGTIRDFGVLGP
jgi:hypothetical protein